MAATLRLGTRGSRLALRQSRIVAERLRALGVQVELVTIVSDGDLRAPDAPIGEGVFVAALERALVGGEIDLAVHSAKDVPLDEDPRTRIVAYPERADPRDALVTRGHESSLDDLPAGARVGTDSPRRAGFVRALRPDLDVIALHGNVDTRLQRLDSGQAEALVLAAAGLDRLGFSERAVARLDPEVMPPAPGQGALAVQIRRDDDETAALIAPLDDPGIRTAVVAERALLKAMGGGCRAPVGAVVKADGSALALVAGAVTSDGRTRHVLRATVGEDVARAIVEAAQELNRRVPIGARALLDTRPELDLELRAAVEAMGFRHLHAPAIAIVAAPPDDLERARAGLKTYDWIVLTSRRGVEALLPAGTARPKGVRWAAVGTSTAESLQARGIEADCVPPEATAGAIPDAMARFGPLSGARVLLARADAANGELPSRLREMGAEVDDVVAYRTVAGPAEGRTPLLAALADPQLEAVIFASGSAVKGLVESSPARSLGNLKVITIGPKTSAAAREYGLTVTKESRTRDSEGLAAALRLAVDEEVERWVESQLRLPA
ncbi:MAG TPA: hydroxymethylbilane synthase [Candidatus Dormibacteraeota bacterium]|nr:hydroxymethylbilane synthase [Candidatus Dormibacteraeota bacterium]